MLYQGKQEAYIVERPFMLEEWGDAYGTTESSKFIHPGSLVIMTVHNNGKIKKLWVDGGLCGEYYLETSKAEIIKNSRKIS